MRNEKLIHALGNCINHCNYCADACLDEENVSMMKDCIRTDRVCAEVCSTLSQVLATAFSDIQGLVDYCQHLCRGMFATRAPALSGLCGGLQGVRGGLQLL